MRFAIIHKDDSIQFSDDTYIYTIAALGYSEIFSSIYDLWRRMSASILPDVYEDLFVLGLSVFAIDKRMSRRFSIDNWTRDISVFIPVHNLAVWNSAVPLINQMLSFLSGDNWDVNFYHTDKHYSINPIAKHYRIDVSKMEAVCLFSGGLDSFCGAISLAEEGKSLLLLGHNEYPKLREKQEYMANCIQTNYSEQTIRFFDFSANARAPYSKDGFLNGKENTCRSRSLLFLSAAISIAGILGKETNVYIPENGFISINVPLTSSRLGSCSTRTTHPYFLSLFQRLLNILSIEHVISNPFQFLTKREVVEQVENTASFKTLYYETISCSHPCNGRWTRQSDPRNCGYCYPCLIRKASLIGQERDLTTYNPLQFSTVEELKNTDNARASDIKALIASVHRYKQSNDKIIKRLINTTGPIDAHNLDGHLQVYKNTMEDVAELLEKEVGYTEELS